MLDGLRAILRRLGIGERRWMRDAAARESHEALVRGRLPRDPTLDAGEPTTSAPGENPGARPSSTDSPV